MRTTLLFLMVAGSLTVACGQRNTARQEVARIGPARLVEAAESVKSVSTSSPIKVEVSEAAWPDAIRSLKPQAVLVGPEGVFVRLDSRFTAESGIFVAFAGVSIQTGPGTDPFFERLADRVYWYEIKG